MKFNTGLFAAITSKPVPEESYFDRV